MLIRKDPAKVLRIDAERRIRCPYCTRKAQRGALLFRKFDDNGALNEILVFCNMGCAMSHAMERKINRGEVV